MTQLMPRYETTPRYGRKRRYSSDIDATTTMIASEGVSGSAAAWVSMYCLTNQQDYALERVRTIAERFARATVLNAVLFPVDEEDTDSLVFDHRFVEKPSVRISCDVPEEQDCDERPWRGICELPFEPPVLFSKVLSIKTADLPHWEPELTFNERWIEIDDE